MSKIMRMCVLVASMASLCGVMSSSAGAITWVNDGGASFTATAGPVTLSAGGLNLICSHGDVTGTMSASPFVGAVWSAASATQQFTGCIFSGVVTNIHCRYTVTAVGQSTPSVTNSAVDTTCDMSQGGTKLCHIHGTTPAHYLNPPHARLIMTASNTLRTTNAVGACWLGHGGVLGLSQQTITLTSPNAPIITRLP